MKSISYLFFPVLLGIAVNTQAQDPMLFYYMETIPQSNRVNPALQPRANAFLMGPAIRFNLNSDFAVKDILQKNGNQWYSPIEKGFDFDKFRKAVGKKSTMLNASAEVDFWGFGFRTAKGKGYFTFELSEHVVAQTALPTDFFNIVNEGFPDGATYDFSPMRMKGMSYLQILIGYSRVINDKLTIGVNLKPILGQVAFTTDIKKFTLNTSVKEWNVDVEGDVYSSIPIEPLSEYSSKNNSDEDFPEIKKQNLDAGDYVKKYLSLKNPGIAIDLGANYKINERWEVSAALNNLGFIHWGQDLNGLTFNGNYVFNGINHDVTDDDTDAIEALGDSLKNAIDYRTHHKKFNTTLAPVLYVGGTYRITEAISVGLLSRSTFWKKGYRQSFNLSMNLQPYSFVAFTIGVNQQIKGNTYLGAGFCLNAGPFQFYLVSDYIPIRYSTIRIDNGNEMGNEIPFIPERQKEVVIRTGFNILFGQHGYQNRPMLDKGRSSWN
ncbi:MAG: DUF5723 family protein [Bacteroidales bacterium]|nr:DUF5723 family protein [Bacteroidales bacterium]